MPGLDYYGADYDPIERGNILFSIPGAAVLLGAEAQAGPMQAYAIRQAKRGGAMRAEGRVASKAAQAKWVPLTPQPNRAGLRISSATLQGKAAELRQTSLANWKSAKSLRRIARTGFAYTMVTIGIDIGKAMFSVGSSHRIRKKDLAEQRRKIYNEDTFMDSRAAFTQRQRAIQVIHNSQLGVRSAMGSEASYLHY